MDNSNQSQSSVRFGVYVAARSGDSIQIRGQYT